MTKIALISDTHWGIRNDAPIFYEHFKRSADFFLKEIDKQNIKHVIHLGDLFDRRKYLNINTANRCREDFLEPLNSRGIETHIISGNHDIYHKNTHKINSLEEIVGNRYEHIKTYSNPTLITIDNTPIQLIPWITQENYKESLDAITNKKAEILFGHLELNGFEMHRGVISNHGMDLSIFSRYSLVASGHYHHSSVSDNVVYLGAFADFIWSDFNDPRGFHIFDTESFALDFYKNPYSIFKMIAYDDVADQNIIMSIANQDYSEFSNCYVKIVTNNKTNPYAFDTLLDKLYAVNPLHIAVVEGITALEENSEENENVDEAEDTPTILKKYIEGLTLPLDNDRMIALMNGIYTDALNLDRAL